LFVILREAEDRLLLFWVVIPARNLPFPAALRRQIVPRGTILVDTPIFEERQGGDATGKRCWTLVAQQLFHVEQLLYLHLFLARTTDSSVFPKLEHPENFLACGLP
jgi:hypothetical protein